MPLGAAEATATCITLPLLCKYTFCWPPNSAELNELLAHGMPAVDEEAVEAVRPPDAGGLSWHLV